MTRGGKLNTWREQAKAYMDTLGVDRGVIYVDTDGNAVVIDVRRDPDLLGVPPRIAVDRDMQTALDGCERKERYRK